MTLNTDILLYINMVTGKPVVCVHNSIEDKMYYYLVDQFKPANPSNHIHDTYIEGRNIAGLLTSLSGYSHGFNTASDNAILTKIEELPLVKITFNNFKWIKIQN